MGDHCHRIPGVSRRDLAQAASHFDDSLVADRHSVFYIRFNSDDADRPQTDLAVGVCGDSSDLAWVHVLVPLGPSAVSTGIVTPDGDHHWGGVSGPIAEPSRSVTTNE